MKLRTKTLKRFSEESIQLLINFIKDFIEFDEAVAFTLLEWATYDPEKFLKVNKWHMPVENLEQLSALKGDLRAFYLEAHPDCWFLQETDFPELLANKLGKDLLVINSLKRLCNEAASESATQLRRISYLLHSEEEKNRYGGLRAINCTPDQSKFLMDLAPEIGDYLDSISTKVENSQDMYIPEAQIKLTAEKEVETKTNSTSHKSSITPSMVMENIELFTSLIEVKKQLDKLNVSFEVFNEENLKKLEKLLEAIEQF